MCLKISSAHWLKHAYREVRRVISLLQKNSWCAKGSHQKNLFQQNAFSFNIYKSVANTNSKYYAVSMPQDRGKPQFEYNFLIIFDICQSDPFDIIATDTKKKPWVTLC